MNADSRRLRLVVEDFDDAAQVPEVPGGCTCERCRTDPTLKLCRADAYEDGRRAGRAEQTDLAEAESIRAAELAGSLVAALAAADVELTAIGEAAAEALGGAVIALVRAALPAACAHLGAAESGLVAAAVLPGLTRQSMLTIEAPDDAAPLVRAALNRLPVALRGRAELTSGASLRIAWPGGQVRHSTEEALAGIDELLDQFGLLTAPAQIPAREEAHHDG